MPATDGPGVAELSPAKRALLEIRALRARLEALESARSEPVAIVGMGCRFPGGATDAASFWRLLVDGKDAITEVPPERWDIDAFYDPTPLQPGKMSTRWAGFIDGIDRFDAAFFGISPREAAALDPQQRLLLEVAWEALEHAGVAADRLRGTAAGVFVGISSLDYGHLLLEAGDHELDPYLAQGMAHSAASGRLSYLLGLHGPSVSLDTACSSSLYATHLAVQSLRAGECQVALAGGVNAILLPSILVAFSRAQMMAADGRCKTFDARADGFVRAEGCGVVVLKRLSDARADGDTVWAVIRGSAANQDGRSSGMTAPNGVAQEAVIRSALAAAGVAPADVGYVETHGTGTSLGDPIEVQALGAVLGEGRPADRPVRLGALKTNVGHLEAAAGVAGLMKAALALHHRELPATLHFQAPNPYIPWADLPVRVVAERTPWPAGSPLVAGVSSFGFTGTNVHVVLEAAPAAGAEGTVEVAGTEASGDRPVRLLKLSAKTEPALDELAGRFERHLAATADDFADVCHTANTGRADLPQRLVVVAASADAAREGLAAHARGDEPVGVFRGVHAEPAPPEVAFLFTGHGAQQVDMGRRLFETEPVFRAAIEECDALLRPMLDSPLLPLLYPGLDGSSVTADPALSPLVTGMTYAQPALFAVEYALAAVWQSWGVRPTLVLGHSVGEYAAACVAGAFGLEDGLRLVAARGRLFDALPGAGGMAAIFAAEPDVARLVAAHGDRVVIAAVNGPTEVVVSGSRPAVDAVVADAEREGIECRRLAVAQAAHSPLLDPILDEFEAVAASVRFTTPTLELVSCTTGRPTTAAEVADPGYWRRHLRRPVRFMAALESLRALGASAFVEVGPHPALCGMGARILGDADVAWLPSLRHGTDDWQQLLESLGALYTRGGAVDWAAFERSGGGRGRRVVLPGYPWQHRSYWIDAPTPAPRAAPRAAAAARAAVAGPVEASEPAPAHGPGSNGNAGLAARVATAPAHEREDLLLEFVRSQIRALLRLEPTEPIERRRRLMELGLDSLMAVELRSRLGRGLGLAEPLPATLVFDYPTAEAITGLLLRTVSDTAEAGDEGGQATRRLSPETLAAGMTPIPALAPAAAADLDALSDEEVEARLLARLEAIEGGGA